MPSTIKARFVLLFFSFLIFACTSNQVGNDQKLESPNEKTNREITPEQQSAFDALNKLQVSTDEQNRLYSTFADIDQPCYPPDTSFVITQSELLYAMMQFVKKHCTKLNKEDRDHLAKTAVLAQGEYKVLHCLDPFSNSKNEKNYPMIGTWVMPGVLDRRDVILEW